MREILFRGKTEEGEWVQGYLVYWQSQICIQSCLLYTSDAADE